jgi:hypothetical protein
MSAAGVTRLAIAGCTEAEIATITGHSLRDVNYQRFACGLAATRA